MYKVLLYIANLLELSFTDSISVEDNAMRLETSALVEVNEHLPHHGSQLSNYLLPVILYADSGRVATGVGVHTGYQLVGGRGGGEGGERREGGGERVVILYIIVYCMAEKYNVHCTCIWRNF